MAEQMQERLYTIPLRKARGTARYKRSEKAMRIIHDFLKRHMKTDNVWVGQSINEFVWEKGIRNPPRRVTVHVQKHNGTAYAELQGVEIKIPSKEEKTKQEKARDEALKKLQTAVKEKAEKAGAKVVEDKKEEVKQPEIKPEKPLEKTEHHKEKKTEPTAKKA